MTSKFWSTLPISIKKDELPEGIIEKGKAVKFIYEGLKIDDNIIGKIETNFILGKEELYFVLENGLSSSGNSYILDPKLSKNNITVKLVEQYNPSSILGFIISVPHSIRIQKDDFLYEDVDTVVSTHLCVSLKHRNKEIAKYLIAGMIDTGYSQNILTGYHYILNPKSESNIVVFNYYRPLNVETAIEYGYEIPSRNGNINSSLNISNKELLNLQNEYNVNKFPDFTIRNSSYEDLSFLQTCKRKLSVSMNQKRFQELQEFLEWYSIEYKGKVVGIIAYKTMVMHVAKIQKGCPMGRVVLLEMKEKYSEAVLSKIISHLQEKRYSVMSGVIFGELSNRSLQRKMGFCICGTQYLDFYNINVNLKKDASDCNLMYI